MNKKNKYTEHRDIDEIMELLLSYENAVHDIKGPLTIIYTYIQLLETDKKLSESAKHQIKAIKRNCFKVIKLITDLNDVTKLFSGYLMPTFSNTNVVELIRQTVDATAPFTVHKSLEIRFVCDFEEKLMATDRNLLERVLLNLLSNAVKFCKRESVIITKLEDFGENIRITVKDNGKGISKDEISHIFDRYRTSDSSRGKGVGLSIVKEIIGLFNGTIQAESTLDEGTAIVVTLPVFLMHDDRENKRMFDDFYLDNMVQIELADEYY